MRLEWAGVAMRAKFIFLCLQVCLVFCQRLERQNKSRPNIVFLAGNDELDPKPVDKTKILDWLLGRSSQDHSSVLQPYGNALSGGDNYIKLEKAFLGREKRALSSLPDPFEVSKLFRDEPEKLSADGKNLFLVIFGEFVANEIVDTLKQKCPFTYMNIQIPKDHELRQSRSDFSFKSLRGQHEDPRRTRIRNSASSWIDGETIYGRTKVQTDQIRSFEKGMLKVNETSGLPSKNVRKLGMKNYPISRLNGTRLEASSRYFGIGDVNGHENPFVLAINVIWFKWHNLIAERLHAINPHWSDSQIFDETRRWVIASQQQIIINEWLPLFAGEKLRKYSKFNPDLEPSINALFSGAALRVGHTMIPFGARLWKNSCKVQRNFEDLPENNYLRPSSIRLCNSFFQTEFIENAEDLTKIILGLTMQSALQGGLRMNQDLHNRVYGPLEYTRRDLVTLNVLRGRDINLPDYISARERYGLQVPANFGQAFETVWNRSGLDRSLMRDFQSTYQNIDNVDLWIGGLLEVSETSVGELFQAIILEQFQSIRDSDFFWFQNTGNRIFTPEEIKRIENLKIRDILVLTLDVEESFVAKNAFLVPNNEDNPMPDCSLRDLHAFKCRTREFREGICYSINVDPEELGECPAPETYDYFASSDVWFISTLAGLILYVLACLFLQIVLVNSRKSSSGSEQRKVQSQRVSLPIDDDHTLASEWIGPKVDLRTVVIVFERSERRLSVHQFAANMKLFRRVDLRKAFKLGIESSISAKKPIVCLKIRNEQDLVMAFDSNQEKESFLVKLEKFLSDVGLGKERKEIDPKKIMRNAYTKEKRQKHLESFFRAVFANAFGMKFLKDKIDITVAKDILRIELTQYEFAESLAMQSDSLFVNQMFDLVDKDNNGYISFREFLDMMVIFAKGSADQKAKLMFDMYDINGTGSLSKKEFSTMIRSMLELANQTIDPEEMQSLIDSMFNSAGIGSKDELTLSDFLRFLGDYKEEFGYVELNLEVGDFGDNLGGESKRRSMMAMAQDKVYRAYSLQTDGNITLRRFREAQNTESVHIETKQRRTQESLFERIYRFLDESKWHVFWVLIFFASVSFLFAQKVLFYAYKSQDRCLHRITGYGVAITRGSASVMMFTFSLLLLTMSRNIITFLRETFLHFYIPFDASVTFHKIVAITGLLFIVVHSSGHLINFYNMVSQRPEDLACYFPSFYHQSHELAHFKDLMFASITGISSVFLIVLVALVYIFAAERSRKFIFNWFWFTHSLYPLIYLLIFLHSLGRVIQHPEFFKHVAVPLALFVLDQLISVKRKKREISVVRTAHYPSEVTMLELKKPPNFDFKSGQWLRIASSALNPKEFHPFTIASAPHEETIHLFIRAVGPFTSNIRKIYQPESDESFPKVFIDGPYGETHQDWFKYPVSVLVGGGIGVTPFASILKDIAHRSANNRHIACKKVYFLWVTRTQKHFEWLVDILKNVEEQDMANLVEVHIFITQFYEKFDLRTTMLYVCERHFQRISKRSLFTGLKAKTQFGRPNFGQFFGSLQRLYTKIDRIGVFSCGPAPMTRSVNQACERVNRQKGALFVSHSENF